MAKLAIVFTILIWGLIFVAGIIGRVEKDKRKHNNYIRSKKQ